MKKLSLFILLGLMFCNVGFAETLNVSGTTWKIKESDGDIKLVKFHKSKNCSYANIKSYSGNEGKLFSENESNCKWNQNGVLITFQMNNFYIVRTGIIKGTSMKGSFITNHDGGIQGTFVGKLNSWD